MAKSAPHQMKGGVCGFAIFQNSDSTETFYPSGLKSSGSYLCQIADQQTPPLSGWAPYMFICQITDE